MEPLQCESLVSYREYPDFAVNQTPSTGASMYTDDSASPYYAATEPLGRSTYNKAFIAGFAVVAALMVAGGVLLFLNWNNLNDGVQTVFLALPVLYVFSLPFGGLKVVEQATAWVIWKSKDF